MTGGRRSAALTGEAMGVVEAWARHLADRWDEFRLALLYYGWLVAPAVAALVVATWAVVKALPRQRRRDDLSGRERRDR